MTRYLFLSGCQRSGKTLAQLILSSHPAICISPGSRAMAALFYSFPRSRALTMEELERVVGLLRGDEKFAAWRIDHDAFSKELRGRRRVTTRDVIDGMMRFFRDQTKPEATVLGNKKGMYSKDADLVKKVFPEARFVFLLRDGRGAISSMLDNQPEHDLVSASMMWRVKATRIRQIAARFPRDCYVLRYESLVMDPEASCRRLCAFLGLDYSDRMLADYRWNDAVRHTTDQSHPDTYEPIRTDLVEKWKRRLDERQVADIEALVGGELTRNGYPLASTLRLSKTARAAHLLTIGRSYAAWLGRNLRSSLRS